MTPCHNCHGGEGTRPNRNELEWLTQMPRGMTNPSEAVSDTPFQVPPDSPCAARRHWPEGLSQERTLLSAYPWWVRENYRETLHRMDPNHPRVYLDLEDASAGMRLGLRHFTYNRSNQREDFNSWSSYTTDIHAGPDARIELGLEVLGNEVPLDRGLFAIHEIGVDGPLILNLSSISRQGVFDSTGNLCILPQNLLHDPSRGFLASQNPHSTLGLVFAPELLNLGGGAWISANLCFPMPTEFRSPSMSEAPLPPSFELNDLLGRIDRYRQNRPPSAAGSDSPLSHLFLSSGQRLQNVLDLLQSGSNFHLELRDLQDLFVPGSLDMGPSRLRLQASLNPSREIEASVPALDLVFQAMGYLRDPDTQEPRLILDRAQVTSPEDGDALRLRYDPIAPAFRSMEARILLDATLSLLQPALRGIHLSGSLDLHLTTEGHLAFGWNNTSLEIPSIRLSSVSGVESATSPEFSAQIRAADATRELLGVVIPPGLRGEWNLESNELHLEGNLVLQGEMTGPSGNYELRAPLAFFTTLRMGSGSPMPIPGSTAISVTGIELIASEHRREILRDGELFFSDDPNQETFRPPRILESFAENEELFATHRSTPATIEFRGVWGNHHEIDLRGRLPLPLSDSEPATYDFSRFLEVAPEIHLDLLDLNPVPMKAQPPNPHFNLVGGLLRGQRFQEPDGRTLWDFRLEGEALSLGRGPQGLTLNDPHLEIEMDQMELQAGRLMLRIPIFNFAANERENSQGLLRGPVALNLNSRPQGGLELELDANHRPVEIRNLDLRFSAQGLDVLPRGIRSRMPNHGRFVGLDGHLEGHFHMNYPEDPRRWNGSGDLRLRGDSQGDIYLLDAHQRRVGPPLLRDTRWRWTRIDGFNWRRAYALGDFHLELLLNPTPFLGTVDSALHGLQEAFGGNGRRLLPGEIWAEMPYDNQPWTPQGFRNRIVDYLETLCRASSQCRPY